MIYLARELHCDDRLPSADKRSEHSARHRGQHPPQSVTILNGTLSELSPTDEQHPLDRMLWLLAEASASIFTFICDAPSKTRTNYVYTTVV